MSFPSDEFAKSWSLSLATTFKIEYTWKIDQIMNKFDVEYKKNISPVFSDKKHDIKFQLQLFPEVCNENSKKFFSLYLQCYTGKAVISEVPVTFYLVCLNKDNKVYNYSGVFSVYV